MLSLFQTKPGAAPFQPAPHALLQRKCACGGEAGPAGECESCRQKRAGTLQRSTAEAKPDLQAPASVREVLQSPGEPLDARTQALAGPRFGHDFSQVRVHTDAQAAQSAEAVSALAYTVGNHLVFAAGQHAPQTQAGQNLLTHELTHVVQQNRAGQTQPGWPVALGPVGGAAENEAAANAARAAGPQSARLTATAASPAVQRQPTPIDASAQAIIDAAADSARPLADRAVDVVQQIINQYFASDASKVSSILYVEATPGLSTTYTGTGATLTGIITVGRYFVENTVSRHFARRVAQVGHEIEHIGQQRAGMGGANRSDEREFLAFYHEALFVERPGTGRMQHSTRVSLIDAALGYYYCLSAALQTQYDANKQELLTRRTAEVAASGNPATSPPTTCRRQ